MVRFLIIICCVSFSLSASAQAIKIKDTRCGTMEMDSINRSRFPQRGTLLDFEDAVQNKLAELRAQKKSGRTQGGVVYIPIIVHVVHNGEAVGTGTNISRAQVLSQIEVLNEDFRKKQGTPGGASTNPVAADIEIEFCLSPIGQSGETLAEPGIHRYNGGRTDWSQEQIESQLKPNTIWNPNKFYNIWTVKFGAANSNLIGYAQFPDQSGLSGLNVSGGPASTDGVVIRYQSFGSTDKGDFKVMVAPYNKGRTLSHETGHWLGLRHIWGDGNCADDFVSDTPTQQSASSGCQIGRLSCNSTNMVQNYMDYSDDACMNLFTEGQKARMQAVIAISPRRRSLTDANLCSPPVAAPPVTAFTVDNPSCILLGSTVQFFDLSSNFPKKWHWKFAGADQETSTDQNPRVKYSVPGTYSVSLWSENDLGKSDTLVKEDLIIVSEEGICRDFNNFKDTYTPSAIKLKKFGNYSGYLTGTNSIRTQALSEFFNNACGYIYISGLNIRFKKAYTQNEKATVNFVVWNARGGQNAPGSVIERKVVSLKQIQDDIANNKPTSIVFDRETPVFGKPFQVGIELAYEGDSLAIASSADGEAVGTTSWLKDNNGTWQKFAIAYGANIAMDIQPIVGMNPSVQVSATTTVAYPGQEITLSGRGASIFVWNSSDGEINNVTGPQLIVNPTVTTTYTTTGSGLELCNGEAETIVYVSSTITGISEVTDFTLHPNPGTSDLTIEFSNSYLGPVEVAVANVYGSLVNETKSIKSENAYRNKINTAQWTTGIYLVKINAGSHVVMKRWIKVQ